MYQLRQDQLDPAIAAGLLMAMNETAEVLCGAFELEAEDYRYVFANVATAKFYGRAPEQVAGRTGADLGLPREEIAVQLQSLRECWKTRRPMKVEYQSGRGGSRRWFLGSFTPLAGDVPQVGFIVVDITARKEAELRAADESRKLKLALDATELGFWEYDIASDDVAWDAQTRTLFSFPPDRSVDFATYSAALHPEDRPAVLAVYEAALSGENGGGYVATHRTADGGRWLRGYGQVIFDDCGEPLRVLGTIEDITDEIQAGDHQQLLLAELNHRVKNNLATVQSIAVQTARNAKDLPAFLASFQGRLVALARTHDVLTANTWTGANLREVVLNELECFDSRVRVTGPDLALTAQMAQALGLVLHELSTNAAKYGALSEPHGVVELDWSLGSGGCRLTWRETGGPLVQEPVQSGFGSHLIARLVNGELSGSMAVEYSPDGLVFQISFPVEAGGAAQQRTA